MVCGRAVQIVSRPAKHDPEPYRVVTEAPLELEEFSISVFVLCDTEQDIRHDLLI